MPFEMPPQIRSAGIWLVDEIGGPTGNLRLIGAILWAACRKNAK
jgi:hypothetical protein